MVKRCFIDTETTGLDPLRHGLVQVAGVIEINGEIVEEFDFMMRPPADKLFEVRALEVIGKDMAVIDGYKPSKENFRMFKNVISQYVDNYDKKDKFFFLAYNAPFDVAFMRQWFLDNGDKYFGSLFWVPAIDVMSLAGEALAELRHELSDFKLGTVADYLGITPSGKLHDAMNDIDLTRQLYYNLRNRKGGSLFD